MTDSLDAESHMQPHDADATDDRTANSGKKRGNSANLKPFQKGVSGNPGGKPKQFFDVQRLARQHSPRAFQRILELVESDDERIAYMASNTVLERAYGKVQAAPDENGKDGRVTINIVKLAAGEEAPMKQIGGQVITLNRFSDGS